MQPSDRKDVKENVATAVLITAGCALVHLACDTARDAIKDYRKRKKPKKKSKQKPTTPTNP